MHRVLAASIGIMVALTICPALLAQEEAKPVILLYHGPKVGDQDLRDYGQALAEAINEDSRLKDKAEIVLVGDQDLMNTLLYFPQVKCVVVALTNWELTADRIVPSLLWYFNQGGGIVGLGNAGSGSVTKKLNGTIFPLFGNQYSPTEWLVSFACKNKVTGEITKVSPTPPSCGPDETRIQIKQTTYKKATSHEIAEGVAEEFSLNDKRFIVHMNTSVTPAEFAEYRPEKGTYTKVYEHPKKGAPLVVVYEENGTSVTFAGTDQMSVRPTDDTYFANFLNDPNFRKLLQNAVYYVWSKETKYEGAMAKAKEEFAKMKLQEEELKRRVEESQKKEKASKLTRSVLLIVIGVVLIVIISYYCFVIPSRQRRAAEGQPAGETPTQKEA